MRRREFLASGLSVAAAERPVRLGFVGVGGRGTGLLRVSLALGSVEVPAVCDIDPAALDRAQGIVEKTRGRRPEKYGQGPEDYLRLVAREDLDAVIVATPWPWHARMSVAAMKAGKYVGTEVPAANTVEECWDLVNTSERTGKPCMILENVCYFRNVMAVLNMVREGLLGELTHCEAGYQHDVRSLLKRPDGGLTWRGEEAAARNGNQYPTHPIGPVAWWSGINRGNRFTYLTSISSQAPSGFKLGRVNTSLIQTASGMTVTLYYDIQSPRPYDLIFRVQGTQGIYSGTLEKIYVEGRSPKPHEWEDAGPYYERYEHGLWKALGQEALKHGHGGADYITMHQFVDAVRRRTQTPIDVYDAATWSVIMPLSAKSVEARSAPVEFPDFTRGKWKTRAPQT
ncbi:MAG: Gfo/Idh/MocA family oxidoreductase [Bryobacterales bacterium]|nr:Gfo/Idh/MocA family oxidoreductase [Bryobacterales bacterium]